MDDKHFFRGGLWVIDLNPDKANDRLQNIFSHDLHLIMEYFLYFLFVDTSALGDNEFAKRHDEIKDGIISIMNKKYDSGAAQICTEMDWIITQSLLNDGCFINKGTPHDPKLKWTGNIHENQKPTNLYHILEGALIDPRSRIGQTINYPPEHEIYLVSNMIRNPLAHGSKTSATIEDYKVLFFILILLYYDIVNPHNHPRNAKYNNWVYRTMRDMRLKDETPTLDLICEMANEKSLDLDKVKDEFHQIVKQNI